MSVNNEISTSGPYAGNDVTVAFSITFTILQRSQVVVYKSDVDGVITTLVLDTDYSVTGFPSAGTVVMTVPPATGEEIFFVSNYEETQLTEFESQGGFFPDVHEEAFDKLTYLILQANRNTLQLPISFSRTSNTLPAPKTGYGVKWDADGNLVEENLDNNLKTDGSNTMAGPLDMSGNRVRSLPQPKSLDEPLRLAEFELLGSNNIIFFNSEVKVFDNIAEMKADTSLVADDYAICKRYYSGGDLVDGLVYEIQATATVDGFIDHENDNGTFSVLINRASKESAGVFNGDSTSSILAFLNNTPEGESISVSSLITVPPLYPSFNGDGDKYPVSITGVGFNYTYTLGEFDDHSHRLFENTRLLGDGGQSLYIHDSGSYAEFSRNTFQNGINGLVLRDSYTNNGYKNHYKNCVNGLLLDNTTSFTEYEIYARGNTTAAIRVQGETNEDVNLIGGAIEGNRGSAIKVDMGVGSQFRLNIQNVYFELDGDTFGGATTPSIDIPEIDEAVHTRFIGGKLSYNSIAGWISGDYNFGYNVLFTGTKISGKLNSKLMGFENGCRLDDSTLNDNSELAFVPKWDGSVKFTAGFGATRGYVFSCPLSGKSGRSSPVLNTTKTAHPYISVLGAGPVISEDVALDYGDGSWTKAAFAASVGNYSSNSIFVGNTTDGNDNQRVYSFLIHSNIETTIQILESQTGTGIQSTHVLKAQETYKVVAIANKIIAGTQRLAVFPTTANAPEISVLCLNQSSFNESDVTKASSHVAQIVQGVI